MSGQHGAGLGELDGRRVVVLGLGSFGGGLGAVQWLCDQGAEVVVSDRLSLEELGPVATEAQRCGAKLLLGSHDGIDWNTEDVAVVNPAIPLDADPVMAAREKDAMVTSEIALVLERWPGPVLGVTGSNGKTTTAMLASVLLREAGAEVALGGNLGGSLLGSLSDATAKTIAVVELSSFMLEGLERQGLGPDVAIITNVTPNHLDRHGSFENYLAAKKAILLRARGAVMSTEDESSRSLLNEFSGEVSWFGEGGKWAPSSDGDLVNEVGEVIVRNRDIPLLGRANRMNLAAGLAGVEMITGKPWGESVAPAMKNYSPPPHRMERVDSQGDVVWIDDPASPTPESTAATLEAIGRPCLLSPGGRDKGLDPTPLFEAASLMAKCVLTIGETGRGLSEKLQTLGVETHSVGTVEEAVSVAARISTTGDVVLFSPGYSSHDQFQDFRSRGHRYVKEVLVQSEGS